MVANDAPGATTARNEVLDTDLQRLVNGLWEAGAEAISLNGQRLTNLSTIRQAGGAITTNGRSLRPPYVLSVIGDKDTLPATFRGNHERSGMVGPAAPGGARADHHPQGLAPASRLRASAPLCQPALRRPAVIAIIGLVIGVVLGLVLTPDVPLAMQPYLPIAVVAALDAVFGAFRAFLDGIFDDKVFVVSFVSNVLIAAMIVFLGDKLGVGAQLSTGVVVVLGIRIFSNVAAIRRHLFHA